MTKRETESRSANDVAHDTEKRIKTGKQMYKRETCARNSCVVVVVV